MEADEIDRVLIRWVNFKHRIWDLVDYNRYKLNIDNSSMNFLICEWEKSRMKKVVYDRSV